MKLFIDSADIGEIKAAMESGVVSGVTTNPSLLKKGVEKLLQNATPESLEKYISEILAVAAYGKEVSLEVAKGTAEEMVRQGVRLHAIFSQSVNSTVLAEVIVKVPISPYLGDGDYEGIKAVSFLSKNKIKTNVTLVFSLNQALLAAQAGATYVSPFVGRIDDLLRKKGMREGDKNAYFPSGGISKQNEWGERVPYHDDGIVSGVDLVGKIAAMYQKQGYDTKVLAASIRHPRQVAEVALAGADIATLPKNILDELLRHTLTRNGMHAFEEDCPAVYRDLLRKP
ncbi:transaldolase [Candidatus Woesearchaeota archaeon]|nr:transaldolase [Candidatus Woesearchaeota archaeon]